MLKNSSLNLLKGKKNLLAFSAGIDSTALFFLLNDSNINFDIAIVDYGLRQQSKAETLHAKKLAKKYNLICYTHLTDKIEKNFEAKAREIRYTFFENLIQKYSYDNLLTAHHLGDRFEWMLMQFCKGAGCAEIAGMKEIQEKQNYTLVRPLLHIDKSELLIYLQQNSIKYFEDDSNTDEKYTRNKFRQNHTNPLLKEYLRGIKKSFEYIDEDLKILIKDVEITKIKEFAYFSSTDDIRNDIYTIDKYLKSNSHMLSAHERELLKNRTTVVIGRKFLVTWHNKMIFVAPFTSENINMPKEFKEKMRKLKIEPKLRTYFFTNLDVFKSLALE
ncbi:MAG: tRNA lysidine(34) synthetase TilS [Sulfurimonas sp.]|nr:tRNA lysidine(34) synthetase TilS [Sulfurimonas sp.]